MKKFLGMLLAVLTCLSCFPAFAFAEDTEEFDDDDMVIFAASAVADNGPQADKLVKFMMDQVGQKTKDEKGTSRACAGLVSGAARYAGMTSSQMNINATLASPFVGSGQFNFIKTNGTPQFGCEAYTWKDFLDGTYKPMKGDFVFYGNINTSKLTIKQVSEKNYSHSHVAVLRDNSSTTSKLYTVDGNTSYGDHSSGYTNKKTRTITSSTGYCKAMGKYVMEFIRPDYKGKILATNELHCYENHSGKNYLLGSDFSGTLDSDFWFSRNTGVTTIAIDSQNKHNGYNSLRIENKSPGSSGNDLGIQTLTQGNVKNNGFVGDSKNMVLSFWAKSSSDGTKMLFRYGYDDNYRSVTLSKNWQRYTVRMDKNTGNNNYLHPYVDSAGTVWLAEMQLEDGTDATAFVPEDRGEYKTVTETVGKKYSLPADPTWAGHKFLGWFTSASGGSQITTSTAVKNGNFSVYAHWDSYNSGRQIPDHPDLILPAGLTEIREEAFTGGAFRYVRLSEQTASIGSRAFARCPNLCCVYIPAKTAYDGIAPDAFEGDEDLIILGKAGSPAEIYAQKHNFAFIAVS